MTKRCPACNKSKHYQCHGGKCPCKCREYADSTKNMDEPDRLSDPKNDDFAAEINEKFNSLHSTPEAEKK